MLLLVVLATFCIGSHAALTTFGITRTNYGNTTTSTTTEGNIRDYYFHYGNRSYTSTIPSITTTNTTRPFVACRNKTTTSTTTTTEGNRRDYFFNYENRPRTSTVPPTTTTITPRPFVAYRNKEPETNFYYWRDYYGIIPNDALEAGTDYSGNPTYIGQSYFTNYILPTIISKLEPVPYVVLDKDKELATKATKILCSTNNHLFKWVKTNIDTLNTLTDCQMIEGGWSRRKRVTIARAHNQGQLITGRLFHDEFGSKMIIHDSEPHSMSVDKFEVLCWNNKTNPYYYSY